MGILAIRLTRRIIENSIFLHEPRHVFINTVLMYHMSLSDVYFRSSIMFFRPSDGASRRRDQWGPVARTPIFANDTATVKRF